MHILVHGLRADGSEFPVEASVSHSGSTPNKLFTVVLRDISERLKAEQVRDQLTRQLEFLSERLATAHEEERNKIVYELHEKLGQELTALQMFLQIPEKEESAAQAHRKEALAVAAQALARVRKLVEELTPAALEDLGLQAAIRTQCRRYGGRWNIHIDVPRTETRVAQEVEKACFRVFHDALENIACHANASEVWVCVRETPRTFELEVRDNGVGFDSGTIEKEARHGLGLFGMQMRAKQAGGTLRIESRPGLGTTVHAVFPRQSLAR
jgi:signal transduction histidine kinase